MSRVMRKRRTLNDQSFVSMHSDSPITRSQTAVLDLFKKYSNNSNMFNDPKLQSVLGEELSKNPGRIMTRHMVTYRPISEIENLTKLAKKQSSKKNEKFGIFPVVKHSRAKIRKSRVRKHSDNGRDGKRRSKRCVLSRKIFPKRKRKGINLIRININGIAKPLMKPLNVTEIQTGKKQDNHARRAYETKSKNDCNEIYLSRKLDDLSNLVNKVEMQEQNDSQTCKMMKNGLRFNQWEDQIYPSRNFENTMQPRKEITLGTTKDRFTPSQTNKDRARMTNCIMPGRTQHGIHPSRTLENGRSSWNNTRSKKHTNYMKSGRKVEHDMRNRGIKTASANETLKKPLRIDNTDINYKEACVYPTNKNSYLKVINDCVKPRSIPLWFGKAVTSVSSYVTQYMPFR